jgi:hypothetical protein
MARRKRKNTVLEKLLIEDFAAEGKSLGRWQGKVVFVERTVPGDVVDVFYTRIKRTGPKVILWFFMNIQKKGGAFLQSLWRLWRLPMATGSI